MSFRHIVDFGGKHEKCLAYMVCNKWGANLSLHAEPGKAQEHADDMNRGVPERGHYYVKVCTVLVPVNDGEDKI